MRYERRGQCILDEAARIVGFYHHGGRGRERLQEVEREMSKLRRYPDGSVIPGQWIAGYPVEGCVAQPGPQVVSDEYVKVEVPLVHFERLLEWAQAEPCLVRHLLEDAVTVYIRGRTRAEKAGTWPPRSLEDLTREVSGEAG